MGVSLKLCARGRSSFPTAVNVWSRSVNATNSTNFCYANTNGTANNTNAYNSLAFAPIS